MVKTIRLFLTLITLRLIAMDFLFALALGKPVWMWLTFLIIVLGLLAFDLGILHRDAKVIGVRESLYQSGFYLAIAVLFGGFIWSELGADSAEIYLTGFLVEKTLALDNIFLISLIFTALAIPPASQYRVLFWGILGVIVLRAVMIGLGATLVMKFAWVLYVFAVFLIITGIKMLTAGDKPVDMNKNWLLSLLRQKFRFTDHLQGDSFVVRRADPATGKSRLYGTPLLLALILIEFIDLIFAVDSVPAIFALTTDPYIVYTSNIFAILGLRALYFALAAILHRFKYLKPALAVLLIFIGGKIFIADAFGWQKFPAALSLGITLGLILCGILVSLYKTRSRKA